MPPPRLEAPHQTARWEIITSPDRRLRGKNFADSDATHEKTKWFKELLACCYTNDDLPK